MSRLGLRVPPAIILGLPLCPNLLSPQDGGPALKEAIFRRLRDLEKRCGKRFGDAADPLLVSVRSGATFSMPGAMLTVLNCGIVGPVPDALERRFGKQVAEDLYLRFLRQCLVGLGLTRQPSQAGDGRDDPLTGEIEKARALITKQLGGTFFLDPFEQLYQVIRLVAGSSGSADVLATLREQSIEQKRGTAINVQQMVFGNANSASCSGVVLSRHPVTGANELYGEFKERAQGEEVVGGTVITNPIHQLPEPVSYTHLRAHET